MSKLTAAQRKHLPKSDFALPGRRYPVNDPNHARAALSRVAQHDTPSEQSRVRAAVHKKYPSIGKAEGGVIDPLPLAGNTSAADSTDGAKHCPSCTCEAGESKSADLSRAIRGAVFLNSRKGMGS